VPAADVYVDGERVGKTPLEATITVTPGDHRLEVRRVGYVSAVRSVTLQDGAQADLTVDPVVDPAVLAREGGWLAIASSETQAVLTVDGSEVGVLGDPVEIPAGPHRIHVERGGFLPAERDVDVPRGGTRSLRVVFEPTPETRARYVAAADSRRAWSWGTLGTGLVVAAAGVAVALYEQHELTHARADLGAADAAWAVGGNGLCDRSTGFVGGQSYCFALLDNATSRVDNLEIGRAIGWAGAGAGGAIALTGAILVLTSDDPHRYDARPVERLLTGWSVLPAFGTRGFGVAAIRAF
jgi:hypothetical protein